MCSDKLTPPPAPRSAAPLQCALQINGSSGESSTDIDARTHSYMAAVIDEVGVPQKAKGKWTKTPLRGIRDDLKRRWPHYWNDWSTGMNLKVLWSTLFMVFTSIAPAITFAGVLAVDTNELIGPVEVILSTFLTGTIFAIFGGQPLCIVGVTGPVTIFTVGIYNLAASLDLEFMPFYCWVQIWAAIMHAIIAVINLCDLVEVVTRYSCETFGMLIATIYLYTGLKHLVEYFEQKDLQPALLSLLLGFGVAWLSLLLSKARSWSLFSPASRSFIADVGTTASVAFFCAVPYFSSAAYEMIPTASEGNTAATIATLPVPDSFGTASGRDWLVPAMNCPTWGIFFAIVPGFVLTILFFFDHNVSSLLCQASEFGLKKGSAYHWDFLIVGLQILITGLLGCPPVNGLIPQAPLHTDSLCEKKTIFKNGREVEVVTFCYEQRVSNLGQAMIIGLLLFYVKGVGYLPIAALDGLFLYMGLASFDGNSFYNRILSFITDKDRSHERGLDFIDGVSQKTINRYTMLQLLFLVIIFVITLLPYVSALFPICIAVLVPLRISKFPKWFGVESLDKLDAVGISADEITADGSALGKQ